MLRAIDIRFGLITCQTCAYVNTTSTVVVGVCAGCRVSTRTPVDYSTTRCNVRTECLSVMCLARGPL